MRVRWVVGMIAALGVWAEAKEFDLYYLGGQSNMDGQGMITDLKGQDAQPVKGVMIFHGNPQYDGRPADGRGIWTELAPGHGGGFSSDGMKNTYSCKFGVELSFARRLRQLEPTANIAIIKYSRGATALSAEANDAKWSEGGCWEPDFKPGAQAPANINQYDHFQATLANALAVRDIDGDGKPDKLTPKGIIWLQGESDAHEERIARLYEGNLKKLMALMRKDFKKPDLPIVIGRITDSGKGTKAGGKVWGFADLVRQAQADFVKKDGRAVLVTSTDSYGYADPYHYDSNGLLDLGKRFAEAVHALNRGGRRDIGGKVER